MIDNSTRTAIESDLNKHHVRYEDPLWDEDESLNAQTSWRVKLKKTSSKYVWQIFYNKDVIFVINGDLLTKKQIQYLLTPDGVRFILNTAKNGCNSMNKFRNMLKCENVQT